MLLFAGLLWEVVLLNPPESLGVVFMGAWVHVISTRYRRGHCWIISSATGEMSVQMAREATPWASEDEGDDTDIAFVVLPSLSHQTAFLHPYLSLSFPCLSVNLTVAALTLDYAPSHSQESCRIRTH